MEKVDFLKQKKLNSSKPSLWHAAKLKHAAQALDQGFLQAYTSHRYWPDGIRRKEDDPLYENSFWMYGWSMTRKREYAQGWSDVLFEFDADKIAETFKIEPLTWNNLFSHNKKMIKKEFEEFVIAHYEPRSIDDMKSAEKDREIQYDKIYDQMRFARNDEERESMQTQLDNLKKNDISWMQDWQKPRGKPLKVDKCVKAIYMSEFSYNIYLKDGKGSPGYEYLLSVVTHPLFKGLYKDPREDNSLLKSKKIKL
jgi:hypothetical protein